jgi:O-antigen/teichoic acid export membrane protein
MVSCLASYLYLRVDRIMLSSLGGESSAGVFSVASSMIEVAYALPVAASAALNPHLVSLFSSNPGDFYARLSHLLYLGSITAWTIVFIIYALSASVIPAILGQDFNEVPSTLYILSLAVPLGFSGILASPFYLNSRLTLLAMQRHILGCITNISLNLMLIPKWGTHGAALGTVAGFAVAHVFGNYLSPASRVLFWLQVKALFLFKR